MKGTDVEDESRLTVSGPRVVYCTIHARTLPSNILHSVIRLLVSLRRRESRHSIEMGFGIDEIFERLDLEVPTSVGDDVGDGDRFVVHFPELGLRLAGDLYGVGIV